MKNYDLKEDEVVLYKGQVSLVNQKGITELILTNINFVLITKQKKVFSEEQVIVNTYPVKELKIYKDIPQIIKKGCLVELYFLKGEAEFTFASSTEARKFVNVALNLLTDKTTFERNAEKFKKTVKIVDNTLEIDSMGIAKNSIKSGFIGKSTQMIGAGIKMVGNLVKKKK